MKKLLTKGLIALLIAIMAITSKGPLAAQAQGTLPPKGICAREGEVQIDPVSNWVAICINGLWVVGTADANQKFFAPATPVAIANPTPIPTGAPTSFNGLTLPTTATSSTTGNGFGIYFVGGATAAQAFTWETLYIAITETGEAYLVRMGVKGAIWAAKIASVANPLTVLALVYFVTETGIEWYIVARPATIVYPTPIAAPEAPVIALAYQDIVTPGGVYRFFDNNGSGNCRVEKFVSWYENGQLQSKLFVVEKPCLKDPAVNKASLMSGLYSKLSEWINSGLITAEVIKQVAPYMDDVYSVIIQLYKGQLK